MKLISYFQLPYITSVALHLSVFVIFVYVSHQPRPSIHSFQTSILFESDFDNNQPINSTHKPTALKNTPLGFSQKKLNLVPKVTRTDIVVPTTKSINTPNLKKYITPPNPVLNKKAAQSGFLRSNSRTKKPALSEAPTNPPSSERQPSGLSSGDQAGSESFASKAKNVELKKPYVPPPSSIPNTPNRTMTAKLSASSIWQRKSDLLVYRNTLAKIVYNNFRAPFKAPKSLKKYLIKVEVQIGPRGNLIAIRPIKLSGLAILDAAAERAIRVSTPFPEFPDSFDKNLKFYRAVFRFTPDKVAN